MRLLLDSHALLWWLLQEPRLSPAVISAVGDGANEIFVSAASAWEICTKHRIGKLPLAGSIAARFDAVIVSEGFRPLAVTVGHGQLAGSLPGMHKDPFDRMLIAQALTESLRLVSNETAFDAFGVARLW